jgi:CheY-like chemotaxis protein
MRSNPIPRSAQKKAFDGTIGAVVIPTVRGDRQISSGQQPMRRNKESVPDGHVHYKGNRLKTLLLHSIARFSLIFLIASASRFTCAETPHAATAPHPVTLSGQDALEKIVLRDEEALTNHLQSADHKAQTLGHSGDGFGTYMLILAAVVAGVVVLRKALPVLALPFIRNEEPLQQAPTSEAPDAHAEVFSDFLEKFNAQQKPSPAANGSSSFRRAEEDLQQLKLPLDASIVAQGKILERVQSVRAVFSELNRAANETARNEGLGKLLAAVTDLKKGLRLSETHPTGHMISAIQALVSQFSAKPESRTASSLRTMAGAIDLLPTLCDPNARTSLAKTNPIRVMAADDDAVVRKALSVALKRVGATPDLAVDGAEGLQFAESSAYDLIFVDIEMPGIDGFELCCRIKNTELNPLTPVVFVTSHNDLATRAKSSLAGGLEFLGKPFMSSELAVKALTLVLKRRLQAGEKRASEDAPIGQRQQAKATPATQHSAAGILMETAAAAS